ncbi:hypothetical protein CWE15_05195 [Aliidiomarina taiwanensis]|uniref:Uncharacterized protein n=1 Tax=Aliidiomarina taiwanensis TaxID=946228 RepID=A0A432X7F4_9GAMM|nr:hypothetical protein [Aliidiomarina taiwanensis]RUO42801.1 hypothetical protein CWE15_05195 [Aliidiomarina taiwanensis]
MIKKSFLVGFIAFGLVHASQALADKLVVNTPSCQVSCSESVKLKNNYVIVVRDEQGSIFHIEQLDLASTVRHVGTVDPEAKIARVMVSSSPDGSYTNSSTERYETPTEIIEVTTHFYFNAAGELIDVQVTEVRFKKERDDTQIEK